MTQPFHIAIDLDDVILDFAGGIRTAIWTEFGVAISEEDLARTGWNLRPLLDPIIGRSWWSWLRDREWLWANFPAIPGALGSIETLRRQGHYLEIVTSKPRWAEHNTWKWLGKWRPAVQAVQIIDLDTTDTKADVTNASILIDDKPSNIESFLADSRHGILFTRPHNRNLDATTIPSALHHARRANNWSHVLNLIGDISNGR